MGEIEKLRARAERDGLLSGHVSWGPEAHKLTVEERAKVINEVLDALDRGDYEVLDFGDASLSLTPPASAA